VQQVLIVNAGSTSLKLHLVHADKKVESIDALESVRGDDLCAIGHRVVYGGRKLVEPALIDDALRESIEDAAQVAPLHNAAALRAIDAAREVFLGTRTWQSSTVRSMRTCRLRLRRTRYLNRGATTGAYGATAFTGFLLSGVPSVWPSSSTRKLPIYA
jgi:hypothetical protein